MIKNAKTLPQVYYGLHFVAGVAEYRPADQEMFRCLVEDETIRKMNPSFAGRPVYVHHVDEVNLENIQNEADGYVTESFFNKADGKHWAKFVVVSDAGHEAIRSGWKLSNAYIIKSSGGGGQRNGVDYDKEITMGEFEHLAIVPDPRYDESIILTPEQFKDYNDKKEAELKKLANSTNGDTKMKFNFFKKEKVDNAIDLESMSVVLPSSKVEKTITQLINEADEKEAKKGVANDADEVEVGKEKMSVKELKDKYKNMCDAEEEKKKNKAKNEEEDKKEEKEEKKENEEDEKAANEDDADEKEEDKKKNKKAKNELEKEMFDRIANAEKHSTKVQASTVYTADDRVALGKSRYGSN